MRRKRRRAGRYKIACTHLQHGQGLCFRVPQLAQVNVGLLLIDRKSTVRLGHLILRLLIAVLVKHLDGPRLMGRGRCDTGYYCSEMAEAVRQESNEAATKGRGAQREATTRCGMSNRTSATRKQCALFGLPGFPRSSTIQIAAKTQDTQRAGGGEQQYTAAQRWLEDGMGYRSPASCSRA